MVDIQGKLEWIPLTFISIFRNKRRSFAMGSGIILGVMLLSGIFIYTTVLEERNFQTVVENAVYEVEFNILENETQDTLNQLAGLVNGDDRVLGSSVISTADFDTSVTVTIDKNGEGAENPLGPNVQVEGIGGIRPVFTTLDFPDSVIGQKLITESNFEGTFDLTDENSTVISRSIASQYRLQVGDVINQLNITYLVQTGRASIDNIKGSLSNITVQGIYEKRTGNSGIFGDLFNVQEFFLSFELLADQLPDLQSYINREDGRFLAVKIDESKFTISDPDTMNAQINTMINDLTRAAEDAGFEVQGSNAISVLLLPFSITSIFLTIFDVLLAAPVVILSLYLLFFGLELSLEERRREIAIKKVQGADSSQIYSELRIEAIVMFVIGMIIGYIAGIFGAWIISSAYGFMQFELDNIEDFSSFFKYDTTAIIVSLIVVGGILTLQIIRKGKGYIEQEVSEQIQRFEAKKQGAIQRLNIDIAMFAIGVAGGAISILEQGFGVEFQLGFFLALIINGLGPFFLWIGGALVGVRLSRYVPIKLEGIILSRKIFLDVARIVKSGIKRRGDTDRLAIIIILTLSIATLAAAQGNSQEYHSIRTTEWEVGSDFQVNFRLSGDYSSNLTAIDGISDYLAFGSSPSIRIFSSSFTVTGFDVDREYKNLQEGHSIGIWHDDSFNDLSPVAGLKKLSENKLGIFVSTGTLTELSADIGEMVSLKMDVPLNATTDQTSIEEIDDIEILGVYDHAPGGIIGPQILTSSLLVNRLRAVYQRQTIDAFDSLAFNATNYLLKAEAGLDISDQKVNDILAGLVQIENYSSAESLARLLKNLSESTGAFGIPGLLTMNFIISVAASLISTFAFSAIIMERRSQEFAVLRAIGAKRNQVYKVAIAENLMLVSTSVVWGIIIGLGITFQFNGVFEIFGIFLGGGPLNREVIFPWFTIIIIGIFTTLGMLLATALSVRSAARQDLSVATRVV